MIPLLAVFFFSLASLACLARAKGVFGNSLAEAEAEEGLAGVFVFVGVVEVTLCESGVLAVGVVGFLSTFTLAALASLSLLVEVGLGVSLVLRPAAGPLAGAAVGVLPAAFTSGWRLLAGLVLVVVVVGLPVSGLLLVGLAAGF